MDIQKIKERFDTRKKVTQKALEDLELILNNLKAPDKVSGYETNKTFTIKFSYWNGHNWVYPTWNEAHFCLLNGEATISTYDQDYWNSTSIFDYIEHLKELDYIQLDNAIEALEEFINKLSNIKTFAEAGDKLNKIAQIFEN